MLSEIEHFVNWLRRRNPNARTWRDYSYDLRQFAAFLGDRSPGAVSYQDIDRFVVFWGTKKLNSTMTYARVYDQTVADDFNAMSRVEQRLELAPGMEKPAETLSNGEREELLSLTEQFAEPILSLETRLELVNRMRRLLSAPEPVLGENLLWNQNGRQGGTFAARPGA